MKITEKHSFEINNFTQFTKITFFCCIYIFNFFKEIKMLIWYDLFKKYWITFSQIMVDRVVNHVLSHWNNVYNFPINLLNLIFNGKIQINSDPPFPFTLLNKWPKVTSKKVELVILSIQCKEKNSKMFCFLPSYWKTT